MFAEHDGHCERSGHHRFDLRSDLAPSLFDKNIRRVRFRGVGEPVTHWNRCRDRGVGRRRPRSLPLGWRRVVVASLVVSGVLVASISVFSSARLVVATAILAGWVAMLFAAPIQSLFPVVVDEELVALGAGYFNTLGFIGAFCASLGFGYLVDHVLTFAGGWLFLASINMFGVVAALALPVPRSIDTNQC